MNEFGWIHFNKTITPLHVSNSFFLSSFLSLNDQTEVQNKCGIVDGTATEQQQCDVW